MASPFEMAKCSLCTEALDQESELAVIYNHSGICSVPWIASKCGGLTHLGPAPAGEAPAPRAGASSRRTIGPDEQAHLPVRLSNGRVESGCGSPPSKPRSTMTD